MFIIFNRKVANISIIHLSSEKTMKLTKSEIEYVKETCSFYTDARMATELTRIRYESDISDSVSLDMVRKARYKLGVKKKRGRGKCELEDD